MYAARSLNVIFTSNRLGIRRFVKFIGLQYRNSIAYLLTLKRFFLGQHLVGNLSQAPDIRLLRVHRTLPLFQDFMQNIKITKKPERWRKYRESVFNKCYTLKNTMRPCWAFCVKNGDLLVISTVNTWPYCQGPDPVPECTKQSGDQVSRLRTFQKMALNPEGSKRDG